MKPLYAVSIALLLAVPPVYAEKPEWAAGKGKGHSKASRNSQGNQNEANRKQYFKDEQREHVRAYYDDEYRGGKKCPPGLRKKQNGCMPPGQAKKWRYGQPIPAGVAVYEVPPPLVVKIGLPPPGHEYVRVASDILLIAIGSKMVVDAISDLGRM